MRNSLKVLSYSVHGKLSQASVWVKIRTLVLFLIHKPSYIEPRRCWSFSILAYANASSFSLHAESEQLAQHQLRQSPQSRTSGSARAPFHFRTSWVQVATSDTGLRIQREILLLLYDAIA